MPIACNHLAVVKTRRCIHKSIRHGQIKFQAYVCRQKPKSSIQRHDICFMHRSDR